MVIIIIIIIKACSWCLVLGPSPPVGEQAD